MPKNPSSRQLRSERSFRGDQLERGDSPIEQYSDSEAPAKYTEEKPSHFKVSRSGVTPMPMLDPSEWGLEDSHEPYALRDASEARLRIVEVRRGTDKNGLDYLQARLEVEDEPYAKDFTHFLHIPNKEKMSAKQLNRVRFAIKSFCEAFDIDLSMASNPEDDWLGQSGWAILGVQLNDQYGEQNFIKQLITPR